MRMAKCFMGKGVARSGRTRYAVVCGEWSMMEIGARRLWRAKRMLRIAARRLMAQARARRRQAGEGRLLALNLLVSGKNLRGCNDVGDVTLFVTHGVSRGYQRAEMHGLRRSPPTIGRFSVGGPFEADASAIVLPTAYAAGYEK